jgi:hypothetical protein
MAPEAGSVKRAVVEECVSRALQGDAHPCGCSIRGSDGDSRRGRGFSGSEIFLGWVGQGVEHVAGPQRAGD